MKRKQVLPWQAEWDFPTLVLYEKAIARVAHDFGLDTYPNQIEIIRSEQMIDNYASLGMPQAYHHWSFGKQHLQIQEQYTQGLRGLAYEMVINANPCISYLLEENTLTMQAIVVAHACYGHNAFFKGNYLFKTWTNPDAIIDYLVFSRHFIQSCEEKHGVETVEHLLDSCHALMNHGVDHYKRPQALSLKEEKARQKSRESYTQTQVNELWRTLPQQLSPKSALSQSQSESFPREPEENILYFLEKHAPLLKPWQREIIRIVRKIACYFYPQRLTKLMNEGYASFWHYTLIHALYDDGLLTDGFMLEFIQYHSALISQPGFKDKQYQGFNPYSLGFHLFSEIKRISQSPTEEDREWFPHLLGKSWLNNVDFAMRNFKDDSFIQQYLSPRLIRHFKLFSLSDEPEAPYWLVSAIHNESGYHTIRQRLSEQYNLSLIEPHIQIQQANISTDRQLILRHIQQNQRPLSDSTEAVLSHIHSLWGFSVQLESMTEKGTLIKRYSYPN